MQKTISSQWTEQCKLGLAWAEEAYDTFVSSVDESISHMFRTSRDEVRVVVFGRTQVGKTSLILTLLGLRADCRSDVARVLRAGRASGYSSTSVATLYVRSEDEDWVLSSNSFSRKYPTAEEVETALQLIRTEMESGSFNAQQLLKISLPKSFFESVGESVAVNIIDLPGDEPSNEKEAKFVRAVASQFVPNADLTLLVGRIDDLGFLDFERLDIPLISDWRLFPQRFRVVTSFSCQAASVQQWMRQQADFSIESLRGRLLQQLQTFEELELENHDLPHNLFYPLDFGDSWERFGKQEPDLQARVGVVMAMLVSELRNDIERMARPYTRLSRAAHAHQMAAGLMKQYQSSFDRVSHALNIRIQRVSKKIEAREATVASTLDEVLAMRESADAKTLLNVIDRQIEEWVSALPTLQSVLSVARASELRQLIENWTNHATSALQCLIPEVSPADLLSHASSLSASRLQEDVQPLMQNFLKRLDGYKLDRYGFGPFSTRSEDIEFAFVVHRGIRAQLLESVRAHWRNELRYAIDKSAIRAEEKERFVSFILHTLKGLKERAAELRAEQDSLQEKHAHMLARLSMADNHGLRFLRLLKEAFSQHQGRLAFAYSQASNASERLLIVLGSKRSTNIYQQLVLLSLHTDSKC